MKLSDLTIIYMTVFICFLVPAALKESELKMRFINRIENNRIMDTVTADAMLDSAVTEWNNKTLVDEEKIGREYQKLVKNIYDPVTGDGNVSYNAYKSLGEANEKQSTMLSEEIENSTHLKTVLLPFSKRDKWEQGVYGESFFSVFTPNDHMKMNSNFSDSVFSGSRMEKTREHTDKAYRLKVINGGN